MAEVVTGIVEKINDANSPEGSARKWTKKSFNVNGEWYSTFLTRDNMYNINAVKEGDAVKLTFETKGNFKNLSDIEVVAKNEPEIVGKPVEKLQGVAGQTYNVQDKEYRITYLAARRDAIEFVKTLVSLDLVSLGTKKNEKVDNFYGYVKEYAAKFAEDAYISREQNSVPVVDKKEKQVVVE